MVWATLFGCLTVVSILGIYADKTKVQHARGRCIYHVNGIQMTPDVNLTIPFTDGSLVTIHNNVDLSFSTKASKGRLRVLDLVISATSMDADMMSYQTTVGQNTYWDAVKTESLKAYFRFDLQVEPKFDPITIDLHLDNEANRYTSFEVSFNCAGDSDDSDPVEDETEEGGDNEDEQDDVTTPDGSVVTQEGHGGQGGVTTEGNEQQEGTTEGGGNQGDEGGVTTTTKQPGKNGQREKNGDKKGGNVHLPKVIERGAVTGLDVVIRSPGKCSYDLTALSTEGLLPAQSYTFDDGATFTSDHPYKLIFTFKPRSVSEVGILGTFTGPTRLQVVAPKGWGTRIKELVDFPLESKSLKPILVAKRIAKPIYKKLIFTWASAEIEELLISLPCKK